MENFLGILGIQLKEKLKELGSVLIWANLLMLLKKSFISDFNSDGLNEIMVVSQEGFKIFRNFGDHVETSSSASSTLFNTTADFIEPGDFNGDGMMDFIINENSSSTWKYIKNSGNFNFSSSILPFSMLEEHFTTYNDTQDNCIVTDFNNDGKSDVILIDADYTDNPVTFHGTYIKWYTSYGDHFELTNSLTTSREYYSLNPNIIGDFNGDGRLDLLNYGSELHGGIIYDNDNSTTMANVLCI